MARRTKNPSNITNLATYLDKAIEDYSLHILKEVGDEDDPDVVTWGNAYYKLTDLAKGHKRI